MPIVFADREITDGCRIVLLLMAAHMTDKGQISVPRDHLAEQLNLSSRRITQRIAEAIEKGLLSRTGGGFKGATAQYEALLKLDPGGPAIACKGSGFPSTFSIHLWKPESGSKVDPWGPTNAGASVNKTRERHDNERDDRANCTSTEKQLRSDEQAADDSSVVAQFPTQPRAQRKAAS